MLPGEPGRGAIGASSGNGAKRGEVLAPCRRNAETGALRSVALGLAPPGRAPVLPLQFPAYAKKK